MNTGKTVFGFLIALLLLLPAAARAQQKGVEITTVSEVEVKKKNAGGKEEVSKVSTSKANVVPGDTVIFTDFYSYDGDKPATNVAIKNPVPENMIYVNGSAEGKGAKVEFSVDGGKTFVAADKLKVKDASGKEKAASAADYTTIRWTLEKPLNKGARGSVSFKARVK